MSKTLNIIKNREWISHVDDEREIGNSIIITLKRGWSFIEDPGCGVRGFDTVKEALDGTIKSKVIFHK